MKAQLRKISLVSLLLLFVLGQYYCCTTHIEIYPQLRIILLSALVQLCLFGAIYLLCHSRGLRAHKTFALTMGVIGLTGASTLIRILMGSEAPTPIEQLTTPALLIYGGVYGFILLIYPTDRIGSRGIKSRNYLKHLLPALLISLSYYGITHWDGIGQPEIHQLPEMGANLHQIDIWLRLSILILPIWMIYQVLRNRALFYRWSHGRLTYYLFGFVLLTTSYLITLFAQNPQSLLMYTLCVVAFFGFSFYNLLQHGASASWQTQSLSPQHPAQPLVAERSSSHEKPSEDKYGFVDKIPHYQKRLEEWMEHKKPFRDKDFRLLDVMQVLPLNRNYLSRLFNEGYGESFLNFVMRYRINESIDLLTNRPELTVSCIAEMCGFSSPSVFGRAFLKNKGITPKQFKNNLHSHHIE